MVLINLVLIKKACIPNISLVIIISIIAASFMSRYMMTSSFSSLLKLRDWSILMEIRDKKQKTGPTAI